MYTQDFIDKCVDARKKYIRINDNEPSVLELGNLNTFDMFQEVGNNSLSPGEENDLRILNCSVRIIAGESISFKEA